MKKHLFSLLRRQRDAHVRGDLASFIGAAFRTLEPASRFLPNWHIDAIAAHLDACARGEVTRLIINMPPRALKSVSVSVAWPAFMLGHAPEKRIMAASYSQQLAVKHSIDCRQIVQSTAYRRLFPNTQLTRDQNEKHKFMTTQNGFRLATSVGGTATGEGGDVLIVDDPLSALQGESKTAREAANAWFSHTFATRLNDKKRGVIVVVMQRLHSDDLSGYLLERGGWEHLCLPAIADAPSIIQINGFRHARKTGDMLHARREDKALLSPRQTRIRQPRLQRPIPTKPAPAFQRHGEIELVWAV